MEGLANYLLKSAGIGESLAGLARNGMKAVDAMKNVPKSTSGLPLGRVVTSEADRNFRVMASQKPVTRVQQLKDSVNAGIDGALARNESRDHMHPFERAKVDARNLVSRFRN